MIMKPLICTRADQQGVQKSIKEGGPRILLGQSVVYRANLENEPRFYENLSYDRAANTFTPIHHATREKLRSGAFSSNIYNGEGSREIGNPILVLLST
jgi:hypothetical protein